MTVQSEENPILLRLSGPGKMQSSVISLAPPVAPTIERIEQATTKKAEGPSGQEFPVSIFGRNLRNVNKVMFGSKPAAILQKSPEALRVMAPAGTPGRVSVNLETGIVYLGSEITNVADLAKDKAFDAGPCKPSSASPVSTARSSKRKQAASSRTLARHHSKKGT